MPHGHIESGCGARREGGDSPRQDFGQPPPRGGRPPSSQEWPGTAAEQLRVGKKQPESGNPWCLSRKTLEVVSQETGGAESGKHEGVESEHPEGSSREPITQYIEIHFRVYLGVACRLETHWP